MTRSLTDELTAMLEDGLADLIPDTAERSHKARNLTQGALCVLHRADEQRIRSLAERERAIYWCIKAYFCARPRIHGLVRFLSSVGYCPEVDTERVRTMLDLGEPGRTR